MNGISDSMSKEKDHFLRSGLLLVGATGLEPAAS